LSGPSAVVDLADMGVGDHRADVEALRELQDAISDFLAEEWTS
jgi:hypothetical protein